MKTGKKLFGLLLLAIGLLAAFPVSAMAAFKGYTISSGNTPVYSNTGLTSRYGTIYGSDELSILTYEDNRYVKVTYPVSGGRTKTGYIRFDALLTASTGYNYTARAKTTTYRRPGGSSYGYVSAGDVVLVLGQSGNYTQIYYPAGSGYKIAFVTNSDLNSKITGDNYENIPNGTYTFTSGVKNGMVMDVSGAGSANGTNIHLWENCNGGNQKFTVTSLGSGWYKITCVANGKAIDVAGGSSASGTNVQLYEDNGTYAQQWKFYSAGNGYYYIMNRLGCQLDVNGAGSANGTNIQVWEKNTTDAQKWKLTSTSYSTPAAAKTYYVTTKAGLILRSGASTSSSKLVTMPYRAAFSVTSKSGSWAYGTYNGRTGYASTQYLSETIPPETSSTEQTVKSRLDQIRNGSLRYNSYTVMQEGKKFTGTNAGEQCKGFARNVFYMLFKVNVGSTRAKPNNHLLNSGSGYSLAGSTSSLTSSGAKNLFSGARPGDFVQMRRSHGGSHSAIVYSVSSTGVTFFEANTDNRNTVMVNTYSWSSLASKNAKMARYTAKDYRLK